MVIKFTHSLIIPSTNKTSSIIRKLKLWLIADSSRNLSRLIFIQSFDILFTERRILRTQIQILSLSLILTRNRIPTRIYWNTRAYWNLRQKHPTPCASKPSIHLSPPIFPYQIQNLFRGCYNIISIVGPGLPLFARANTNKSISASFADR